MSFKAKEPTGTIVHNPACAWCSGSGMIRVPDYDYIGAHGHYDAIMNDSIDPFAWQACTRSVYCHECYPEPPVRKGEIRYPNLLDHIDAVKARGIPGEMDVLIAVLLKHSPGRASTIRFDALDRETRELVESLLEAMEEK